MGFVRGCFACFGLLRASAIQTSPEFTVHLHKCKAIVLLMFPSDEALPKGNVRYKKGAKCFYRVSSLDAFIQFRA